MAMTEAKREGKAEGSNVETGEMGKLESGETEKQGELQPETEPTSGLHGTLTEDMTEN